MTLVKTLIPQDAVQRVGRIFAGLWRDHKVPLALFGVLVAVVTVFYGLLPYYGNHGEFSTLGWLESTWTARTGYDHGWVAPLLIGFLILRRLPQVAELPLRPSSLGVLLLGVGVLAYLAAIRTGQPRVALGGLPFLLVGGIAWVHGWRAARLLAFPIFLLYFVIPVPGLIQATNGLQLLATKAAYVASQWLGIEATLAGNQISSVPAGKWGFDIAEGCSGVRSLMALTLIGAVYAHLTQDRLWKKAVIFFCSFPLAIVGNSLRVASILVVAEFISPEFAARSYHEGSGFLFFAAVGLVGLMGCDWLLNQAGRSRVVTRRVTASGNPAPAKPVA